MRENIECVDARDPIATDGETSVDGWCGTRRERVGEGWVKRARKSVVSRELESATRTRRRGSTVVCDDAGGEEKKKKKYTHRYTSDERNARMRTASRFFFISHASRAFLSCRQ